jgi:hypothetical protein
VDEPATTIPPCKVQPDGSEVCETIVCPQRAEPGTDPAAPQNIECAPPEPLPEPEPLEIVLVDAEPALVLLAANDGSADVYLVPGYRFTDADGGPVDLPAVADEALTGTPETTVPPESIVPDPGGKPAVDPQPCGEVLVQEDESGTTHTVQPNPDCVDPGPATLAPGEEPKIGVGYYVDAQVTDDHCTWLVVELGGVVWWTPGYYTDDLFGWSQPTEGGTFTLTSESEAEFVGDADRTKVATLVPYDGDGERPVCE